MNQTVSYETQRLDHLGIVAGICQEVGLAGVIDEQVGKPTQRPTMRRVFQVFEGIDLLLIVVGGHLLDRQVLYLTTVQLQIIALMGAAVRSCYTVDD